VLGVVRSIALVALAGVVTATVLFVLTSGTRGYGFLGPLCAANEVAAPGFDPWTGEPHGRIFDCVDRFGEASSATTRITAEPPIELMDRQAVPLPAGFAIGAVIAVVWLTVRSVTDRPRA
jgi:hypothetical protein